MGSIMMSVSTNGAIRGYELTDGKTKMSITVTPRYVSTLVINASHKAWRGMGKTFHGADALGKVHASYKAETTKAMIALVMDEEKKIAASKENC